MFSIHSISGKKVFQFLRENFLGNLREWKPAAFVKKTFLILEMEIDLFKHPFQLEATGSKFCLALDVRKFKHYYNLH